MCHGSQRSGESTFPQPAAAARGVTVPGVAPPSRRRRLAPAGPGASAQRRRSACCHRDIRRPTSRRTGMPWYPRPPFGSSRRAPVTVALQAARPSSRPCSLRASELHFAESTAGPGRRASDRDCLIPVTVTVTVAIRVRVRQQPRPGGVPRAGRSSAAGRRRAGRSVPISSPERTENDSEAAAAAGPTRMIPAPDSDSRRTLSQGVHFFLIVQVS